jgi:hypothetical protein
MAEQSNKKHEIVDLPHVSEHFSDAVISSCLDENNNFHVDFGVTRLSPTEPDAVLGKRYTVCRLVLTPKGMLNLFEHIQHHLSALEKHNVIKYSHEAPSTTQ